MASPFPQLTGQDEERELVNAAFEAIDHTAVYAKADLTTSGLVRGYYGGRWGGFSVAAGTLTLTNAATNYVVVERATGVITTSTSTTNWNSTSYSRVYKITTAGGVVTAEEDHRAGPSGVHGSSAGTFSGGTLSAALNEAPAVTLASASTVNIGAAAANTIGITGTTTITAFDTIADGARRLLVFAAALTLTHNATSLILPTGANITTAANDVAEFLSLGSGNWRCIRFVRKDGTALVGGYLGIPQNSKSAAYTTVLADAGKHLYHPSADTTARIWTIDSNANVPYDIGTAITFVNDTSAGIITISITSDTLVLAGAGSTGSRALAANGIATAVKMTSTRWMISGTGLT
jgi:hypothetical protein